METISMIQPLDQKYSTEPVALAIGFFDGLHKGHQKVIQTMIDIANQRNLKKAVMTFDPHPSVVLNPAKKRTDYLTPLEEKKRLLEEMGIDQLYVVPFTSSFANLSEKEFIENYLAKNNVKELIAGFDFTYGRYGKGNMLKLNEDKQGFNVTTVSKEVLNDEKISTTQIRDDLKNGRMLEANEQLGRPYELSGIVVQGEKRGRTIGFPTANIQPDESYVLPKLGVYAVTVNQLSTQKTYKGVCNVGVKPTFHDPSKSSVSIEVHIFDFNESIYGERVEIKWHEFIRPEQKFSGIDALIAQINKDKLEAQRILDEKVQLD